jgi:uncharacterized membrane protein
MSNRIRALVIASLLLNILFTGIFIGHFFRLIESPPPPHEIEASDFNLTDKQLLRIEESLHATHRANQPLFEKIQEKKDKALLILKSSPFDAVAYQAHVDAIHQLRGRSLQQIVDTVKELAPMLDDSERAALAEIMRHPPPPPEPFIH